MGTRSAFLDGALRWIYDGEVPDSCPACGYRWDTSAQAALDLIASAPSRIIGALDGRDGSVLQADGSWNATAYVWHLTDIATIWSERWIQVADSPGSLLVGFDPDELAAARNYRALPTSSGTWALERAVDTFVVTTNALPPSATFEHADWGTGTVADALRWLAHEFHHHTMDIDERASDL